MPMSIYAFISTLKAGRFSYGSCSFTPSLVRLRLHYLIAYSRGKNSTNKKNECLYYREA